MPIVGAPAVAAAESAVADLLHTASDVILIQTVPFWRTVTAEEVRNALATRHFDLVAVGPQ